MNEIEKKSPIANRLFEATYAECELEEILDEAKVPYEKLGWDYYDCSLEIYGVANDWRMPESLQRELYEAGFSVVYVNHKDEWETHYSWGKEFKKSRGWRRRWVNDPAATTTRSIGVKVNPENSGYYEISYWPDSWKDHKEWMDTGYMRIVPDSLEDKTE